MSDDSPPLDEVGELYGYAVYNTRRDLIMDIPKDGVLGDNVATEPQEDFLQRIADQHGWDDVSNLRVVQLRLDNDVGIENAEYFSE